MRLMLVAALPLVLGAAASQDECDPKAATTSVQSDTVLTNAKLISVLAPHGYVGAEVYRLCDDGHLLYVAFTRATGGGATVAYAGTCTPDAAQAQPTGNCKECKERKEHSGEAGLAPEVGASGPPARDSLGHSTRPVAEAPAPVAGARRPGSGRIARMRYFRLSGVSSCALAPFGLH